MRKFIYLVGLCILIISCARMASPSGGVKDGIPPKFMKSVPDTLSLNVDTNIKDIKIYFDEYIILKDVSTQMIISPPLKNPIITPVALANKYITIKFNEKLEENTTYAINFGGSIQDNNEGNKLPYFSYVFSTGSSIDSLGISGKITQSLVKEPNNKTVVVLYKQDSMDLDLRKRPYYLTRVNKEGNYELKYLHEGNYRLVAFVDEAAMSIFDPARSDLAIYPEIIKLDSNIENIDLSTSPAEQTYKAMSVKQTELGELKFNFRGKPKEVKISPIGDFPEYKMDHKQFADSLYLYFDNRLITDKENRVNLKFVMEYQRDSLVIDTLKVTYDKTKKSTLDISKSKDIFIPGDNFSLFSNNYIKNINSELIEIKKDSQNIEFNAFVDSLNGKKINLNFHTKFEERFKIQVLPEAFTDYSGNINKDTLDYGLLIGKADDLGNLELTIKNNPKEKYFLQMMNEKREIIKEIYVETGNNVFNFPNSIPGKYIFRILVDENGNGRWDGFDLRNYTPAEKTYLHPKEIEIRAFWDIKETWEIN